VCARTQQIPRAAQFLVVARQQRHACPLAQGAIRQRQAKAP
jgi:hypothetical protein